MNEIIYNKRPAYLNNEIVKLFNDKIKENNIIASDYLNIPYEELTDILIDEEYKSSEEHKELNGIISYIFDEIIKHKRLSSKK